MKSQTTKKIILVLMLSTQMFAGGDNKVTMTDMKEALYNLVISSDKTDKSVQVVADRVSKMEPSIPEVERNSKNVSAIIERLNTLGVPSSTSAASSVSNEITRFVSQNRHYLPEDARGVK